MGKPKEKQPTHSSLAPDFQRLPQPTLGDSDNEALSTSSWSKPDTGDTSSEGHPMRSEASASVSGQAATTFLSPSPSSWVAHVPSFQTHFATDAESRDLPPLTPAKDPTEESKSLGSLGGTSPRSTVQMKSKPSVKMCVLCTGEYIPVKLDTSLMLPILRRLPNIDPNHIISIISQQLDDSFDSFFDPIGIYEGEILILIVSCHGRRDYGKNNVILEFISRDGARLNSRVLQQKVASLPQYCTLEVIVDTCCAEGVVPGLHRIFAMNSPASCAMPVGFSGVVTTHAPPSGARLNTKFPAFSTSFNASPNTSLSEVVKQEDRPHYRARVVVWAASTGSGNSFTEEDLPGKPGVYSILIGAIFSYLSCNGLNISRRKVWESVVEVVGKHNYARHVRDLLKPPECRAKLINRIQSAVLLTSVDKHELVLDGLMFQPI